MKLKNILLIFTFLFLLTSCSSKNKSLEYSNNSLVFVTKSYMKKQEGYDWTSVKFEKLDKNQTRVIIRSRADKKRPTCTFDGIAYKKSKNKYISYTANANIVFIIKNNKLNITTEKNSNENSLYFYCSGGATLKAEYIKYNKKLDLTQLDNTQYQKSFFSKKVNFFVTQKDNILKIQATGLKYSKEPFIHKTKAKVFHSEIADINEDGNIEIYIYLKDKKQTKVIVYSVNNHLSATPIYISDLKYNKEAFKGYTGLDNFKIANNKLVRTFPLENGKTKRIEYKLIAGEATWQLKIDKIEIY